MENRLSKAIVQWCEEEEAGRALPGLRAAAAARTAALGAAR